jgi:hypothetical protein
MRRTLTVVAASAVALVGAAAPASAKLAKQAYFRLDVKASQHVAWSHDLLTKSCGDSVTELHAGGTGDVSARDQDEPWAVAKRTNDARRMILLVHGEEPSSFAVAGKYVRDLHQNAFFTKPPSDPNACPKSLPGSPDCGTRGLPAGALMYVNYVAPGAWPYPKPKPKGGMLTLSGPIVQDWFGRPPFQLCGGANGDDTLAGTWYDPVMRPMAAALSPSKLLGTAKHFSVSYKDKRTVETGRPGGSVLEDTHPVTTTIHWKVTFTRIGPQLQTPGL